MRGRDALAATAPVSSAVPLTPPRADGAAPGLRRITQAMPMEARELYALFPGGPGILAARIAGLPKPKSCV